MQRHFFATADDLLKVFDRVEAKRRLAYTLAGVFQSREPSTVHSGAAIPSLRNLAPHPSAVSGYDYLVTDDQHPIVVRKVPQRDGGHAYAIDQLANPDSIMFLPGGAYPPNILLYGRVGTASATLVSNQLHRAFASAIGKLFQRVRAYYVGPGAYELWKDGHRLTISADSPPAYDLAAPQSTHAV